MAVVKKRRFAAGGDIPDFSRLTFKEAFAAARGGPGQKTPMNDKFTWNGKTYTTEMAKPKAKEEPSKGAVSSEDGEATTPTKAATKSASADSDSGAGVALGALGAAAAGAAMASRRGGSSESGARTEPRMGGESGASESGRSASNAGRSSSGSGRGSSGRGAGGSSGGGGGRPPYAPGDLLHEMNPQKLYAKGGKVSAATKSPMKAYAKGGMVCAPASEPKRSYPKKK